MDDKAITAIKQALSCPSGEAQPEPEQEPVAAVQLLNRLERQWHRMGELWERCQGKGWPSAESDEFTALRDEKTPANRKELLALYTTPPQRKPLDMFDVEELAKQCGLEWSTKLQNLCDMVAMGVDVDDISSKRVDETDENVH